MARVRTTAADVARQLLANLLGARLAILLDDVLGDGELARRAVAALGRVMLCVGLDERPPLRRGGDALRRLNGATLDLDGQRGAGKRGNPVDEHAARTAAAAVAHLLGTAGEAHGLLQRLTQRPLGLDLHLDLGAVDNKRRALRDGSIRVVLGKVGLERLEIRRFLAAHRAHVHEVGHGGELGRLGSRRFADDGTDTQGGRDAGHARAPHLEEVAPRNVVRLRHAKYPSLWIPTELGTG